MSLADIKKLREMTSLGINECKKALHDSKGDFDKALKVLKEKGASIMASKKDRKTLQGIIQAYVHFGGNLGALVEINCETDFVARTEIFKKFAKDIAMQVAAVNPKYLKREDVPQEALSSVEDKEQYIKEHCLFEQFFIKDNALTVADYLKQVVSQTGENVIIKRFSRFSLEG
ncbi:MAG: elongation factor Ts [Candidatus Omnitrophota bacterium]|jgi:elongation factor Ts